MATTAESDRSQRGLQPLSPLRARRWQGFPATLLPIIGREREVAAVTALLREPARRLVTLTGPGGVGKTRLALAVAREAEAAFADGAVFVPLAAIRDPALVLPAVARALEIRESRERPLAEVLQAALHDRRMMLVLDNFEQVLAAATEVGNVFGACSGVTVLVTSRAPLRLRGEQRFLTPPLALPGPGETPPPDRLTYFGAIAFFVERARWVRHDFALNDGNAPAITEICRRLDGLPLAIELAAAWVRVLTPASLLERMEPRLPLLHGGAADQPARLQTMRDAIAWSYDLVSEEEARFFRRLAVFVGGFTLEAAEWVSGAGDRVSEAAPGVPPPNTRHPVPGTLDLLAGLIDKGLLQAVQRDAHESRFVMLETVREFGLERLAASGEETEVRRLHALAMRELAERAEPHLLGPRERQWDDRLDADLGNLRAALTWSLEHDLETALRIGAALWVYWAWYHLPEGRRWLTAALARAATPADPVRLKALITDAALAGLTGDVARSLESAGTALTMARAAGNVAGEALAGWIVATGHLMLGDFQAVVEALDHALPRFDQATTSFSRRWAAYARSHRGAAAFLLGDIEGGLAFYEEALTRARLAGSDGILLVMLSDFAGWLIELGEASQARDMLQEALALSAKSGGIWLIGTPLIGLALVDALRGDAASAARRLGAVEAVRVRSGLDIPGHFQARVERATALARAALGEDAYAAIWEAGRADPEAVIASALRQPSAAAADAGDVAAAYGLSPRQQEVLALLVTGLSDKEIAAALFVSRPTASKHVAAILAKLGVDSRTAAVSVALQNRSG
jgi:predicted ATPase/DNA-binding CsgD family transcriptional regulator